MWTTEFVLMVRYLFHLMFWNILSYNSNINGLKNGSWIMDVASQQSTT
jgi:hypothetical protein